MNQPLVNVIIDGRTVQVPKGMLLVEAAKQAGIDIPVFCYHPKLDPAGVCRMCLVQIEKIPKPQTACTTQVSDGMVVHTQNEAVHNLQKGVLEFLLINHPLDCPVCDKGGECDLQDHTFHYGPAVSRLQDAKVQKEKSVDLGNFIVLDNERCILCRRCTRFDDEIATEGNLIIEERGHLNYITTLVNQGYDSYFSGNTIELCPVGALTSELYRFKARPWDLAKVDSVCTGCSVGCNVKQEFRHGQFLRLTSRENPSIDDGWLCDRGRFNYKFVQSEERLTSPLIKRDGEFAPAAWSEALTLVAERLGAIKEQAGGSAIGVIGGGRLTNEEGYLLQKFARTALGTNNLDHRVGDQLLASLANFPGRIADISDAGAILVVDTDPAECAPVMDLRIRRMTDRKRAKVAVIGSVLPKYRGRHGRIQTRPGETAAVIRALAAACAGAKAVPSAADPEALTRLAGMLTGTTKVVIIYSGRTAGTGRAVLELGNSLRRAATGADPGRTVHLLIPGAQSNSRGAEAMGVLPTFYPGFAAVTDTRARTAAAASWQSRNLPADPGLDTGAMLKAAAAGEIQALVLAGANLLNTWPDRSLAEAALRNSFVVALDLFVNESAELADVILPVAALSEKAGSYTALDGLVQTVKPAKRPEGSARSDGDILVALGAAMGSRLANTPVETAWEIAKLVAKLEDGVVLAGAPATLLGAADDQAAAAPAEGELLLVPVDRLYAGGSTARFDREFNHVQPRGEAFLHPTDAATLGLKPGEQVEMARPGGGSLRLSVGVDKNVVAGTVQAVRGLPDAPINLLTGGGGLTLVTLAKLAVEVAD